jgi:hypothetical protein
MTAFLGNAHNGTSGVGLGQVPDDIRLEPEWLDHDFYDYPQDESFKLSGFVNGWWPGIGGMDASGNEWLVPVAFDQPEIVSGATSRYGFSGVTRDAYGTVITGATVRLFRTSDSLLVDSVTSNAVTGAFVITTPYWPDAHFIVASKSGVPDLAGTTVQTLVAG